MGLPAHISDAHFPHVIITFELDKIWKHHLFTRIPQALSFLSHLPFSGSSEEVVDGSVGGMGPGSCLAHTGGLPPHLQ